MMVGTFFGTPGGAASDDQPTGVAARSNHANIIGSTFYDSSGAGVEFAYDRLRARVPALTVDRPPTPDIAVLARMIEEGEFEGLRDD